MNAKNEVKVNVIGYDRLDTISAYTKAATDMGIDPILTAFFTPYAKSFFQRRKIGGNEALLQIGIQGFNKPGEITTTDSALMTLGYTVRSTLIVLTSVRDRVSNIHTTLLFEHTYRGLGDTLAAYEGLVEVAQTEVQEEEPVKPSVTKDNFDIIAAYQGPAQACADATSKLLAVLFEARQDALSYCPNETLSGLLDTLGKLHERVFSLQLASQGVLEFIHARLKRM